MTNEMSLLADAVLQSPDWRERRRAARFLGKYVTDESRDTLLQVLRQENDGDVLQAAILSLLKLGSKEMLELITKPKIMMSPDESVRWACAHALGSFGYVPPFEQIFRFVNDQEWTVRNETISTLEQLIDRISHDENFEASHFEQNILLLIRMLQIENAGLQDKIIRRIVEFNPQLTEQHVIEALETENELIKVGLIKVLGNMKSKNAVPRLIPLLTDGAFPVAAASIEALGKIGGLQAINALILQLSAQSARKIKAAMDGIILQKEFDYVEASLIDALQNDTNTRRKKCILAIMGEIRLPSFRKPIFDHLGDTYFFIRKHAAEALLKYGESIRDEVNQLLVVSKVPIDEMIQEAKSGTTMYRRLNAIKALGMLRKSEALSCIEELSQGDDHQIAAAAEDAYMRITEAIWARANAALILGELGGEKSIEPLLVGLKDESSRVRWAAITALRQVKSEKTVDIIVQVVDTEKFAQIRREAVKALGDISFFPENVKKIMYKKIQDKSPLVRQEVARVLGKIHDEPSIELLFQCFKDNSFEVRRNALNALYSTGMEAIPKARALLATTDNSGVKTGIMQLFGMLYVKEATRDIEAVVSKEKDPEVIACGRQIIGILNGKPEDKEVLFV